MLTAFILKILIALHFGYHAVAALSTTYLFVHSHIYHKKSYWKIALAVLWLVISVALIFVSDQVCS